MTIKGKHKTKKRHRWSSVDRLSDNLRAKLNALLNDPKTTQKQIAEAINEEAGGKVISASAVNRYAIKTREQREKTQQAQVITRIWAKELGEDLSNPLGRVTQELLRTQIFDIVLAHEHNEEVVTADTINNLRKLSSSVRDLEHAANANQERERKLRLMLAEQNAKQVETRAKSLGLNQEMTTALRDAIKSNI